MTPKYSIGTKFTKSFLGKKPRKSFTREYTVIDVLTTKNLADEVVCIRYITTHDFCGQAVTDNDVPESSITRALFDISKVQS